MGTRQKHHWIGWGYDTTLCEHCRIDAYDELQQEFRTEYCDELPGSHTDRSELLKSIKAKNVASKNEALDYARSVLTNEQWQLIGINHPYRVRDYI